MITTVIFCLEQLSTYFTIYYCFTISNIGVSLKIKAKNLSELVNSQYKLLANNNTPILLVEDNDKKVIDSKNKD